MTSPHKSTNGRSPVAWPVRAGFTLLGAVSPALAGRAGARLSLTPPRRRAARRWGREVPAGADPFTIRYRARAIRGWALGTGPAVLLVHGWGGRSDQLGSIARALAAAGCCAVAFDAPAHGRSGGRTTSMVEFADAAAEVARRFRARAAVGHSLGGAAVAFAASRGLALDAAVLVAPPTTPVAFVDALAAALRLSPATRAALDERIVRRVGLRYDEVDVARCAPASPPPALVLHDDEDAEVPLAAGTALARAWGARLVVTTGLGHRRILGDGPTVDRIVAFVTARLPRCECGRLASTDGDGEVPRCDGCAIAEDLWAREARRGRNAIGDAA